MSKLDDTLENIISGSGFYFYETEVEAEIDIKSKIGTVESLMQRMWDELPDDANIAIYGLGWNFNELLDHIDLSTKNVVCIIDRRPEITELKGYPVIRIEALPKYQPDIVLITPRFYFKEMEARVKTVCPDCKIIDVAGEYVRMSRYLAFQNGSNGTTTEEDCFKILSLNEAVGIYLRTNDFRYLLYVIHIYLQFRDIKNALSYIGRYIESGFPNADKMLIMKTSIVDLLNDLKLTLSQKHMSHCLVIVSDSVDSSSFTAENAPFLYSFANENIQCSNAYAHMCWTSTSFLTIFKQKSYLDNHLYGNPILSGDEPFFDYLDENNIDFVIYSAFSKSVFSNVKNFLGSGSGCAYMLWQYLCSAYDSDKKTVNIFHLSETHDPCLFLGYIDPSCVESSLSLYAHSLRYVDSQAGFLLDLLPPSAKLIFCSDHGRGNPDYSGSRCKIPYVIRDGMTRTGADERLVSHLDTADIVLNLINDRAAFDGIALKSFVEVNGEFYYSREHLELMKQNLDQGRAFKCYISEWDKYVVFYDGEEKYFLLPDENENLIDDQRYAERVDWFRANFNTEFPDWSDDNGRYDVTREYMDITSSVKSVKHRMDNDSPAVLR